MKNEVLKELRESIDDILFKYDAPQALRDELRAEIGKRVFSLAIAYAVADIEVSQGKTDPIEYRRALAFKALSDRIEQDFAAVHPTHEDGSTTYTVILNVLGHPLPAPDAVVQGYRVEDKP